MFTNLILNVCGCLPIITLHFFCTIAGALHRWSYLWPAAVDAVHLGEVPLPTVAACLIIPGYSTFFDGLVLTSVVFVPLLN